MRITMICTVSMALVVSAGAVGVAAELKATITQAAPGEVTKAEPVLVKKRVFYPGSGLGPWGAPPERRSAGANSASQPPLKSRSILQVASSSPRKGGDAWRYRLQNGQWWYYQESGQWLVWSGQRWTETGTTVGDADRGRRGSVEGLENRWGLQYQYHQGY